MELRLRIFFIVSCLLALGSFPANSEIVSAQSDTVPAEISAESLPVDTNTTNASGIKDEKIAKEDKAGKGWRTSSMAMSSSADGSGSVNSVGRFTVSNSNFSGAAVTRIPIEVPPGRNNMAPNLTLTYVSHQGNGWVGVGWNIDMGAIQRSTKFGVHYNDNAFIAIANGSSLDLVPRGDWGANYYGAKIEGAFLKYFDNTAPAEVG
jgi:hypothetical protein